MKLSLELFANKYQPHNTDPDLLKVWAIVEKLVEAPGYSDFRVLPFLGFLKRSGDEDYSNRAYENGTASFYVEDDKVYASFISDRAECLAEDLIEELELMVEAFNAQPES